MNESVDIESVNLSEMVRKRIVEILKIKEKITSFGFQTIISIENKFFKVKVEVGLIE